MRGSDGHGGSLLTPALVGIKLQATPANGSAECDAAADRPDELAVRKPGVTLGADNKACDIRGFLQDCRDIGVTPPVAQRLTGIPAA